MPWDGKTWDNDGTMLPKPGPGHWQPHERNPDKLQWVVADGTPTVFVRFRADMNDDRVADWAVTNDDDVPLADLNAIDWGRISRFKFWVKGREVSRAEFDVAMQKWREENHA